MKRSIPAEPVVPWELQPIQFSRERLCFVESPDLSKVDEVGFVDLMPGSDHGSSGYVNVAPFELYGTPVKRGEGK